MAAPQATAVSSRPKPYGYAARDGSRLAAFAPRFTAVLTVLVFELTRAVVPGSTVASFAPPLAGPPVRWPCPRAERPRSCCGAERLPRGPRAACWLRAAPPG